MKLSNDKVCFNFSKSNKPVLHTTAPVSVTIQTLDCFSNQLRKEDDKLQFLDWDRINPATGPVYVEIKPINAPIIPMDIRTKGERIYALSDRSGRARDFGSESWTGR